MAAWCILGGVALGDEPPGYYDGTDGLRGEALRLALHDIVDDHQRFPYTSSAVDTWDIVEDADQDAQDSLRVRTVYRNTTPLKDDHSSGSGFNREHSWPISFGFPDDHSGNYPFTDVHALRAANWSYNSARGNRVFAVAGPGATEYPVDAEPDSNWGEGTGSGGAWEVWSGSRGDIARAILYLDLRYEGGFHGVTGHPEPDLIVTDDRGLITTVSDNASVAHMGLLQTLLQWHLDDPVDSREQRHNDVVYSYQDNRNPFVDRPEWVLDIWGDDDGPAQEGVWLNEIHYDDLDQDEDEGVEIAARAGTDLAGWTVVAYDGSSGVAYDTLPLSGLVPAQEGGFGTLWFAMPGLQNGAPDGLALVDPDGRVAEFLSYEGSFLATDGPALGRSSQDLGVEEAPSTRAGRSLQRIGRGNAGEDFRWVGPRAQSRGEPNRRQTLTDVQGMMVGSIAQEAWINEIHYDNSGTDANEGIEVAGTAGMSLAGWTLVAYNGNGGARYDSVDLGGSIPDLQAGLGTLWFPLLGLQNGSPDGVALVDADGVVVQFLSYEGSFTAVDGPAAGTSSQDIGVSESSGTGAAESLQLGGQGRRAADFHWQPAAGHTRGAVNQGQTFQ